MFQEQHELVYFEKHMKVNAFFRMIIGAFIYDNFSFSISFLQRYDLQR